MNGRQREPGEPKAPKRVSLPPRQIWMAFLAALLVNFLVARIFFPSSEPITVPYTAFKQEVADHNVEAIYSRGESIEGRFSKPVTWPPANTSPGEKEAAKRDEPFGFGLGFTA